MKRNNIRPVQYVAPCPKCGRKPKIKMFGVCDARVQCKPLFCAKPHLKVWVTNCYPSQLMDNISKKPSLNLFIHAVNIEAAIDETPTIDAEPVRHGKWIEVDIKGVKHHRCTECDEYIQDIWTGYYDFRFCPNCGAKMMEVR